MPRSRLGKANRSQALRSSEKARTQRKLLNSVLLTSRKKQAARRNRQRIRLANELTKRDNKGKSLLFVVTPVFHSLSSDLDGVGPDTEEVEAKKRGLKERIRGVRVSDIVELLPLQLI
jgi:hypothetical protein